MSVISRKKLLLVEGGRNASFFCAYGGSFGNRSADSVEEKKMLLGRK